MQQIDLFNGLDSKKVYFLEERMLWNEGLQSVRQGTQIAGQQPEFNFRRVSASNADPTVKIPDVECVKMLEEAIAKNTLNGKLQVDAIIAKCRFGIVNAGFVYVLLNQGCDGAIGVVNNTTDPNVARQVFRTFLTQYVQSSNSSRKE